MAGVKVIVAIFEALTPSSVELVVIVGPDIVSPMISYWLPGINCSSDESINMNPFSRSESILTNISIRNVDVSSGVPGLIMSLKRMLTS